MMSSDTETDSKLITIIIIIVMVNYNVYTAITMHDTTVSQYISEKYQNM